MGVKGAPIVGGVANRRSVAPSRVSWQAFDQSKQARPGRPTMDKNELLDRMRAGTISRRQLGRIMAGAGIAFTTMGIRGAKADEQAIYFTWSGYDDPGFFPGYVKKYGVNPALP